MPPIPTTRALLRPVRYNDAAGIAAGLGDREVARWLAHVPHPYRIGDARTWIASVAMGAEAGDEATFAVEIDGALAGIIGLHGLRLDPTLGYWLARSHWGRGVMGEAVGAALAWAFATLPIAGIRSGVFEGNAASLRIQQRLGFRIVRRGPQPSLALGRDLVHIETFLARGEFTGACQT